MGSEFVQFKHDGAKNNCYYGMHAFDDNNNNRKGCSSFKEVFLLNDCNLRQFGHFMSTFQTNSHLGNTSFSPSEEENPSLTLNFHSVGQGINIK